MQGITGSAYEVGYKMFGRGRCSGDYREDLLRRNRTGYGCDDGQRYYYRWRESFTYRVNSVLPVPAVLDLIQREAGISDARKVWDKCI
jgi:hypothetical protein